MIDLLVEVNGRLARDIRYLIRMEPGVQTPEQTLVNASGSCRDSGWLLVQLLRNLGLAARFVSGYLIQLVPDVKSLDGPSGPVADFTDLHAWCEVYLPGAGWIGLDPTSGLLAGEGHIPLACTPEPSTAAPVSGEVEESKVEFSHEMSVARVWEAPRVTKPYTEEQWRDIDRLGHEIDTDLSELDVRLTMGGEPTFVSLDDPDGAEWNTAALGPEQAPARRESVSPVEREVRAAGSRAFRAGQVVPGRAAAALVAELLLAARWRADLAEPRALRERDRRLRRHAPRVRNAFSRPWRWVSAFRRPSCLLRTRTRSITCGASGGCRRTWTRSSRVSKMPGERERLARIFEQGLDSAVGYVFPVARDQERTQVADRPLVSAAGTLLPAAGRFAGWLSLAARFHAVGLARRLSVRAFARPCAAVSRRSRGMRRFAASCRDGVATTAAGITLGMGAALSEFPEESLDAAVARRAGWLGEAGRGGAGARGREPSARDERTRSRSVASRSRAPGIRRLGHAHGHLR